MDSKDALVVFKMYDKIVQLKLPNMNVKVI
jgi:hypothetical protein